MEKNIQIFTDERFGEVRTAKLNGVILFAGADVARSLGYTNPQKAIRDHVDEEDRTYLQLSDFQGVNESFTPHQQGANLLAINESGVYTLIFRSKKKEAQQFRRWITTEVIPAIRRTGKYSVKGAEDNINQEFMTKMLNGMMEVSNNLTKLSKHLLAVPQTKATTNYNPKVTPFVAMHKEPTTTVHPTPRFRALVNEMMSIFKTKKKVAEVVGIYYGTLYRMTSEKPSINQKIGAGVYEKTERRLMHLQRKLREEGVIDAYNLINTFGGF